ncbi:MAG: GH77 [uncultured Thermomicrobiales bacterium]|uniref:4-alpha-glucanotransferase n=1 Tax=uncultured Thermomicrobiales bacterium TaxID=1645740 RepID=A0A6J4VBS5_9BACT|nr:MAG: GH77 [uncultured Thermomicrobiales bacterium]
MDNTRASGILLHPTSLPGRYGIGELGAEARAFLDFLVGAGQTRWQVLPLGPTGYGDSPYQSFSAFAGNPLLISTDRLLRDGLLTDADLDDLPAFPADTIDYGPVIAHKQTILRRAYDHAKERGREGSESAWDTPWLDDYALFMALKDRHEGAVWSAWEPALVAREPTALARARVELADEIGFYRFCQARFFADWGALKREANARGVAIVGDLPIFVAYDSVDVWANQGLFFLDGAARPTGVAGVPPDYFSETGQLWGNPLYRWDVMARDDYDWWVARLRTSLALFDLVRIDHFRGFAAYWEIPADEQTAINGRWVTGPGATFFDAVRAQLGDLPIIAEDLGLITDDVLALRDRFGLPGMKVLQFAPSDPGNPYLPHHYEPNCVVYTGTHDNDTTRGWWATASADERDFLARYLGQRPTGETIAWQLIRLALGSVAQTAIMPLQDLLELGSEARMNTPGTGGGNWAWRYDPALLTTVLQGRLKALTELYSRGPNLQPGG